MGGTDHDHPWRDSVVRRIASAAVVAVALLAAYGCGASGSDTSVGTDLHRDRAVQPAAADDTTAGGLKTVTYQGVEFDVPADWPVHDLAAEPTTCVRFDVNAVYLGHPSPDMDCPAGLVGRAEAVLVEPVDGNGHGRDDAAAGTGDVAAATASGLEVQVAGDGAATSEVDATIPSAGVSVTLTYRDTDATAQQILGSFRTVAS
jgi:hypothetical protein